MTDRRVFSVVMGRLAALYRVELSPGALDGYWVALEDLSDEQLARAAMAAMKSCTFMPVPSELLKIARSTQPACSWHRRLTGRPDSECADCRPLGARAIAPIVRELADGKS
jgi:hypothetical protein